MIASNEWDRPVEVHDPKVGVRAEAFEQHPRLSDVLVTGVQPDERNTRRTGVGGSQTGTGAAAQIEQRTRRRQPGPVQHEVMDGVPEPLAIV